MKIKSSSLSNKIMKRKRIDTIFMDTDSLLLYDVEKKLEIGKNIKNIIISKKMIEEDENYISIYDTRANNIYFEGETNFGDLSIPINYLKDDGIALDILNENIECKIKSIKFINKDEIVLEINLDDNIEEIEIRREYEDYDAYVNLISKKDTVEYFINEDGIYETNLHCYKIGLDDLDSNKDLDVRKYDNYKSFVCPNNLDINTLVVDKDIFINSDKYYVFGFNYRNFYPSIVKKIRIVEDNDMKLVPFDKTFEIKDALLHEVNGLKYLYIVTNDDEVVLYLDNDNIKCISKNELLKDNNIKYVYFIFRKLSSAHLKITRPMNIILKEYNDGKLVINDLKNEYEIDDNFKINILDNLDKLNLNPTYKVHAISDSWKKLFLDINFDNGTYQKMLNVHLEAKRNDELLKSLGLKDSAIEYLKLRGLVEKLVDINVKLKMYEIEGYNELGDNYIKYLKK